MAKTKSEVPATYAEALTELKGLAQQIEQGSLAVDELGTHLRRMAELVAYCQARLADAELEITKLDQLIEPSA